VIKYEHQTAKKIVAWLRAPALTLLKFNCWTKPLARQDFRVGNFDSSVHPFSGIHPFSMMRLAYILPSIYSQGFCKIEVTSVLTNTYDNWPRIRREPEWPPKELKVFVLRSRHKKNLISLKKGSQARKIL